MKERLDVRMTPTEMKRLRAVAIERKRSKADTVRVLIDEEHVRIVASRGETEGSVDGTKRGDE